MYLFGIPHWQATPKYMKRLCSFSSIPTSGFQELAQNRLKQTQNIFTLYNCPKNKVSATFLGVGDENPRLLPDVRLWYLKIFETC